MISIQSVFNVGTSVAQVIKSYISKPTLAGVSLELTSCKVSAEAKVSQHLIVTPTGYKQIVNDNVAPSPRVWSMTGYIPEDNFLLAGVQNTLRSIAGNGINLGLRSLKDQLWEAFYNRVPVEWKDKDGNVWKSVAIEKLETEDDPTITNKVPMNATVRELVTVNSFLDKNPTYLSSGNSAGSPTSMGTTVSSAVK